MNPRAIASDVQPSGKLKRQHGAKFAKALDKRKHPIRGLWVRNGRYYARLAIEDEAGNKVVRRVALMDDRCGD